jgi:hypothetical protein
VEVLLFLKWDATSKIKDPMKTKFTNKVIMFLKTFEFKNVIMFCRGKHKYVDLQQKVLRVEVWAIVETITSTFNLVVLACVMN